MHPDPAPMMVHGDHICLIHDGFPAQLSALVPFLRLGFEAGDRCVYVCAESDVGHVEHTLRANGVDVDAERARGALRLLTPQESYLATGRFEPAEMVGRLRQLEQSALADGFTGLRVSGDMSWALAGNGGERVVEYESLLNEHFPGSASVGLCQYDRRRFSPELLEHVLRTHPMAVVDDRPVQNFFYEPPHFNVDADAGARLEWKLDRLTAQKSAAAASTSTAVLPGFGAVVRDINDRRRSEALLSAQKHSLELVVAGAPLDVVLTHLVKTVEQQAGGTVTASILLLDEESRLRNGASPGLESEYLHAIDGLPAYANLGTCCAAAALRQVVVTRSFANDPRWQGLSHLPMAYGFVAAWSMPILARDGSVLGTFGTYFRECRGPTPVEREVVEVLARTASIAIERGRAEAALRDREAFNRRLLESSGDCIKVLDLDGRIQSINEAGRRLMRVDDVRNVIGRDYRDFWQGEDRVAADRALTAAAAGREGRFEGFSRTSTGEPRWWDVLATPIADARGTPYCMLVISRDITEQHETQDRLRAAMAQAEAANRAKGQFLAVMSHELRTPLTGIIGYADLLGSGMSGEVSGQQQMHVSRIQSGAWHLVSIIDEILTFSRVEAGKEQVMLEHIDFVECVRESAVLLQPQSAAKGIALRFVAPEHPLRIETDAGKLRQIVLNLAGNAVKFTEKGYVELRIEVEAEQVVLTVRDSGPGIPPDKVERVFDPFVQVDQSNTRAKGGTGLGLTVSRSLAQLLGGDVSLVDSAPGVGSMFALRLPRQRIRAFEPSSMLASA